MAMARMPVNKIEIISDMLSSVRCDTGDSVLWGAGSIY